MSLETFLIPFEGTRNKKIVDEKCPWGHFFKKQKICGLKPDTTLKKPI